MEPNQKAYMYTACCSKYVVTVKMCTCTYCSVESIIQVLSVQQIKKLQTLIDDSNQKCTVKMKDFEAQRHTHLTQIGNILHPSVPISDNEVYTLYMYYCISKLKQ